MSDHSNHVDVTNTAGNRDFNLDFKADCQSELDSGNELDGGNELEGIPSQACYQTMKIAPLSLVEGSNLDQAIDVLASLLRDFGHNAFDLPTLNANTLAVCCDAWVKHVLFATAPPGGGIASETLVGGKRDWKALHLFFKQQRCQEKEYVQNSLNDLRNVLWTCIGELDKTFQGEAQTDDRLRQQMQYLQITVMSKDLQEIKQAVQSTVTTMNRILEQQRDQQKIRMEALHTRIHELDSLLIQARKENSLDPLTNLFNRKAFSEQIANTLNLVHVFEEMACLFVVDVDHFKAINDTYGHPAGDATLCALAECFARHFSGRNDCVARYGGEEFVIICQEMTLAAGRKQAERLLAKVRDLSIRYPGLERDIPVTISIGLTEARPDDNASAWIDRADQALYRAKQNGRNRLEVN